jgi:hypothetical protein
MIKELFLAIILGALLGLGVTGGYFALQKNKTPTISTNDVTPTISIVADQITPTPTIEEQQNKKITITSPENNIVVASSKLTIKGSSLPNNTIIANTLTNSYTNTTTETGSFSLNIELESGANEINLTSIDSEDNQIETKLTITYSTTKF